MHALIANDFLCYARASNHGWTAHCVDLDLAASGRTLAEAQERLQRAIQRHIEALAEADEFDDEADADKPVVWTVPHPLH